MKMKKILKVALGVLGSIILITAIVATVFYIRYKDWVSFHQAMIRYDYVMMDKTLDNGFDIDQPLFNIRLLPLCIFYLNSDNKLIKYLLDNGADANKYYKIPLPIYATAFRRPETVQLLIKYGVDTNKMFHDKTITDVALVTKQPEIIMMIPEDKINSGIFMLYNPELIERVIQYYYEGQTDDRILNHWEKHGYFSKTYIDNIRNTKK